MAVQIILDNKAKKDLRKIPAIVKKRVIHALELLKENPIIGIPLSGEFKTFRKVRLGDYRIVYKYYPKDKIIVVSRVKSRQNAYKN